MTALVLFRTAHGAFNLTGWGIWTILMLWWMLFATVATLRSPR